MKKTTVGNLDKLNKEFYTKVAPYFHSSRKYYWKGWERLLPFLSDETSLNVLDVGCGNGRFGAFLKERLSQFSAYEYIGLDFDAFLLEKAQELLPEGNFIQADFLSFSYEVFPVKFGLVSLFGVLHHIPSYEKRLEILTNLKTLLTSSGKLVFSTWEFTQTPGFPRNTVPWEEFDIDPAEVEDGDYLLTWSKGVDAVRYCHYISPEEAQKLCSDAGLIIHSSYKSEAPGDSQNRYFITGV